MTIHFWGLLILYAFSRSIYILCSFPRPLNAPKCFSGHKMYITLKIAYHVKLECLELKEDHLKLTY